MLEIYKGTIRRDTSHKKKFFIFAVLQTHDVVFQGAVTGLEQIIRTIQDSHGNHGDMKILTIKIVVRMLIII